MSKCNVIALVNRKGGVAKTTSTLNLGAAMARMGKKVLLVDYDDQCSLTRGLGLWDDVVEGGDIGEHLQRTLEGYNEDPFYGILTHKEGMDLLPGSKFLPEIEKAIFDSDMNPHVLGTYVSQIQERYDYILFDCPASFNALLGNVLVAADQVIIPTIPETLSAMGFDDMLDNIDMVREQFNPNLKIAGILITRANLRTTLTHNIQKMLKEAYPDIKIFDTSIPQATAVAKSPTFGESIFVFDKRCPAAAAYEKVASEVVQNG